MDEKKIGVFLNYINLVLRIVSQFWVTRVLVTVLGDSEYGLIATSSSVLVMLPLLDFGMTATITRYAAEYKARNDLEGLRDFLGVCQKFFYGVAAVAAICCFVIYFRLPDIFHKLSADELHKLKIMFIMLSCGSVINFTLCIYTNVLNAFQKFFFTNIFITFSLVFTAIGSVLFVKMGYGAVGVTMVGLALQLISIFPARVYCWKKLNIVPNLHCRDWKILKTSFHYSIWIFIGSISNMVGENLMPLIVGSVCGLAEVTTLKLGTIIAGYFMMGSSVAHVFFPQVVNMVTHNATREELTRLLVKVGRLEFLMGCLFVGGFVLLGQEFYQLWVEQSPEEARRTWSVGLITSAFVPVAASMGVAWYVLYAKNLVKFRVIVSLGCNIAGTLLGYYLALKFGLFGLLWARFAFAGVLLVCFSLFYFHRIGGLDIPSFMKQTYLRGLVPVVLATALFFAVKPYFIIADWYGFAAAGGAYVAIYALVAWMIALSGDEKKMVGNLLVKFRK